MIFRKSDSRKTRRIKNRRLMQPEMLEDRRLLATFVVTSETDILHGECAQTCSLRDAITAAEETAGEDTIVFAQELAGSTVVLRNKVSVSESIEIQGLGINDLTIAGIGSNQLLHFGGSGQQNFRISNVKLSGGTGNTTSGGAIRFGDLDSEGDDILELDQIVIQNSDASGGGAIYSKSGTLLINNSSFINNRSFSGANGDGAGGSVILLEGGASTIVNSTFSNNKGIPTGAAIQVRASSSTQTLEMVSSSFVGNETRAINVAADDSGQATVTLQATLFSQNQGSTLGRSQTDDSAAEIISLGNNLSDDNAGGFLIHTADLVNANANLGPRNAITFTHTPLPGSPAIDSAQQVTGSILPTDQLGNARQGSGVDIGAVEVAYEMGDAPTAAQTGFEFSYPTLGNSGAIHLVGGPRLGPSVVSDRDGQPTTLSNGDDLDGQDDEDGIEFLGGFYQTLGDVITIFVNLQNADTTSNLLDAWVDWNRNGSWDDDGEQFATSLNLGTSDGLTPINLDMPEDLTPGPAYFRFRLSTDGGLNPGGTAPNGEVEDHLVAVVPEDFNLIVDNLNDVVDGDLSAGQLSLREAIHYANATSGDDIITFAEQTSDQAIVLTGGDLTIRENLTIRGMSRAETVIDAGGLSRIFNVAQSDVGLTIENVTLAGGQSPSNESGGAINFESLGQLTVKDSLIRDSNADLDGGAIYSSRGKVDIRDSKLTGNSATGSGGAVHAYRGELLILHSTVAGNSAGADGGGILSDKSNFTVVNSTLSDNSANQGGAIFADNNLTGGLTTQIIGSTISGNTAELRGGGLLNNSGLVTLSSSTITLNSAPSSEGSGISSRADDSTRTSIGLSIVSGNGPSDLDVFEGEENSFDSIGFNIVGSGNGIDAFASDGDQPNTSAMLQPLANNGGSTQTHALMPGSPALDSGSADLLLEDRFDLDGDDDTSEQFSLDGRGANRVIDLDGIDNVADGTDIGAVEMIGLMVSNAIASETDGQLTFDVSVSDPIPFSGDANLTVSTVSGTAEEADFTALVDEVLPLDQPHGTDLQIQVALADDPLIEPDEQFTLQLTATGGVIVVGEPPRGTITSEDQAGLLCQKN